MSVGYKERPEDITMILHCITELEQSTGRPLGGISPEEMWPYLEETFGLNDDWRARLSKKLDELCRGGFLRADSGRFTINFAVSSGSTHVHNNSKVSLKAIGVVNSVQSPKTAMTTSALAVEDSKANQLSINMSDTIHSKVQHNVFPKKSGVDSVAPVPRLQYGAAKKIALKSDSSSSDASSVDIVQPRKRQRDDEDGRESKRQRKVETARPPISPQLHGTYFEHPKVGRYQLIVDFVIPVDEV